MLSACAFIPRQAQDERNLGGRAWAGQRALTLPSPTAEGEGDCDAWRVGWAGRVAALLRSRLWFVCAWAGGRALTLAPLPTRASRDWNDCGARGCVGGPVATEGHGYNFAGRGPAGAVAEDRFLAQLWRGGPKGKRGRGPV